MSSICCSSYPKMTTRIACHPCNASSPRISRDGVVMLSGSRRESSAALGSSYPAAELHLGRRISRQEPWRCANIVRPRSGPHGWAQGLESSLTAFRQAPLCLRRVSVGNKLENDREEAVSSSPEEGETSVERKEGGLVERIEAEMGRQFGGVIWFSVLLLSLALFGGVYVFLLLNYADFNDIPIIRGPQR